MIHRDFSVEDIDRYFEMCVQDNRREYFAQEEKRKEREKEERSRAEEKQEAKDDNENENVRVENFFTWDESQKLVLIAMNIPVEEYEFAFVRLREFCQTYLQAQLAYSIEIDDKNEFQVKLFIDLGLGTKKTTMSCHEDARVARDEAALKLIKHFRQNQNELIELLQLAVLLMRQK
jgi:hypothetical protein